MIDPIVIAAPVFMASIVVEAVVARLRGRAVYDLADAVTSLHFGVLSQVVGGITKVATFAIYLAVYHAGGARPWPADSVLAWIAALLIYDFCYYWEHRLSHEMGILWAAHVVHHSSEYYNLTTALRQTASGALLGWIFFLPLAVIGVPPVMFAGVAAIDLLYQYWVHTELIGRLGVLDSILVTPSNHRVHHGQNDYCIDKNYGGILILWDRLFGTFTEERADETICYGIRKPLHSFNPLWGNLHFYADLWAAMRAAPSWRAAIGVCFAPPGGWPKGPPASFAPAGFTRYAPPTPAGIRLYGLANYIVASLVLMLFLIARPDLSAAQLALYLLVISAAVLTQGGLLQGARWARGAEALRLILMLLLWAAWPGWAGAWPGVGLAAFLGPLALAIHAVLGLTFAVLMRGKAAAIA